MGNKKVYHHLWAMRYTPASLSCFLDHFERCSCTWTWGLIKFCDMHLSLHTFNGDTPPSFAGFSRDCKLICCIPGWPQWASTRKIKQKTANKCILVGCRNFSLKKKWERTSYPKTHTHITHLIYPHTHTHFPPRHLFDGSLPKSDFHLPPQPFPPPPQKKNRLHHQSLAQMVNLDLSSANSTNPWPQS